MDPVQSEVDRLYKLYFGHFVVYLMRFSSDINIESAEDLIQDTFTTALQDWNKNGIPGNPKAWIHKVCKHNAINFLKKKKQSHIHQSGLLIEPESIDYNESILVDQTLILLFACAHPDLSPKAQVMITLKYVINLKTEVIARILGLYYDAVEKLLFRARQKIKDEKIILKEPLIHEFTPRLSIVHKIIYLIFNEGYKSALGKELIREELCEEALLLNRILLNSPIGNKQTAALQALMLFNSARLTARFGINGEIIDLENQDRSLWNKELIELGCTYLHQSRDTEISTYQLEASIAYLHSTSKSFEQTDWNTIADLYKKLLLLYPNPFVELNYAIVLYYAGHKIESFQKLKLLEQHPFINQYYPLNAALGKLYHLEGDVIQARHYLLKAHQLTTFVVEKNYINDFLQKTGH